ncbi:thermonuclease family protein [Cronobacter sakazakii]
MGQRSKKKLTSIVAQLNATITGEETDRYRRRLDIVWFGAKGMNTAQLCEGLAWVYPYHGKPAWTVYAQLEAEARRQSAGLWSVPCQTEPWRWRSQHQDRGSIRDVP